MKSTEVYQERLRECPRHDTPQFIDYLRNNNVVVAEDDTWLLIENCKYHRPSSAYYTAFLKAEVKYQRMGPHLLFPSEWSSLFRLYKKYCDGWEVCIKAEQDRSIDRFHVHFVEYGQEVVRKHRLGVND